MPTPCNMLPSYSVVVPTRLRSRCLDQCLHAVRRQTLEPAQIVVVDNSAGDASTEAVARAYGCIYAVMPRRGLSVARNIGAELARSAELVLFLDDDATADIQWGRTIAERFSRAEKIGVVTGSVHPPNNLSDFGRLAVAIGTSVFRPVGPLVLHPDATGDRELALFGGAGIGANMGFKRILFDQGFRFNERADRGAVVEGGGEHLAFFDALQMGFQVAHEPAAIVTHPVPEDIDTIRINYLRDRAAMGGFYALVISEVPAARAIVARRFLRKIAGGQRRTSTAGSRAKHLGLPRLRPAFRFLRGFLAYAMHRIGMAGDGHTGGR
jgi:O-antigen biosynthesis protein